MIYKSILIVACFAVGIGARSENQRCDMFSRHVADYIAVDCNNSSFMVYDTIGTMRTLVFGDDPFDTRNTYSDVKHLMGCLGVTFAIINRVTVLTNRDGAFKCDQFYGNDGLESDSRDTIDDLELPPLPPTVLAARGNTVNRENLRSEEATNYDDDDDDNDDDDGNRNGDIENLPSNGERQTKSDSPRDEPEPRRDDATTIGRDADDAAAAIASDNRFMYIVLKTDDDTSDYRKLCDDKDVQCRITLVDGLRIKVTIIVAITLVLNAAISAAAVAFFSIYQRRRHYENVATG